MKRWTLGGYELKYNPSSNEKEWSSDDSIITNINGNTSNPNLAYSGSQRFSIDIYDEPTRISKNNYVGWGFVSISEKKINERLYLLGIDGNIYVHDKSGGIHGSFEVTSGTTVTKPTGEPKSIAHLSSNEIAVLYKNDSTQSTVAICDENGVVNRKYVYSNASGDISSIGSIVELNDSLLYGLSPRGMIFSIDINNGNDSFVYKFESDSDSEVDNSYKSIIKNKKNNKVFIGVLRDNGDLVFINEKFEVSCISEFKNSGISDISMSDYSGDYFSIVRGNVFQAHPNTCRLDIDIIKNIISSGNIEVYDELGFPSIIVVSDLNISRKRNMYESRYEVSFNSKIAYNNKTFDNIWQSSVYRWY